MLKIEISKLPRFAPDYVGRGMYEYSGSKWVRFQDVKKLLDTAVEGSAEACAAAGGGKDEFEAGWNAALEWLGLTGEIK